MSSLRKGLRATLRGMARWKLVFDVLTLTIVGLIAASYWLPTKVNVGQELVDYWFYVLTIFVGAREVSRWIGDHQSGRYVLRFITHGEIYLLLFLLLPFSMGVPEAFLQNATSSVKEEVMALATGTALKVSLLYVTTAVSKGSCGSKADIIKRISTLAGIFIGHRNKNNDDTTSP